MTVLLQLTTGHPIPPWVGAARVSNSTWKWNTGSSVSSTFWAKGEPSIYGDCATLRSGSVPGMSSCPCYNQQPALCKLKPKLCNDGDFGGASVRFGTINSPGFPNQYYNNLDCYYQLRSPTTTYITITFDPVKIENYFDYVDIFDGGNKTKLIGQMDTYMPSTNTFESTTNSMLVYFHTDSMVTDVGWSAQWSAKVKSSPIVQNGTSGEMSSPNYPNNYGPFLEQMYLINSDGNSSIFAMFDAFRTESNYDYLEIYDGGDIQSKLLANFSGANLATNTVQTTTNRMTMRFITDGSLQFFGWHMIWNNV
uniref:C-type lectin and CUB domain containing protein n=1 Tax=Haemonchus contortus TaxID=6289 RepID=W6NCE8_HAECO